MDTVDSQDELMTVLRDATKVVVFSGAGISAESGVPTFRDAMTGLWSRYRPQDLATPEAFKANPKLVWEWYAWRRRLVASAAPNAAHRCIASLQSRIPELTVITQNVDGLHERAGSRNVLTLHGNIQLSRCFACKRDASDWSDDVHVPPLCLHCGGYLRPAVVWFGEELDPQTLDKARLAAKRCEVLFSIGTSSLVYPAAELPHLALETGAMVIQINPAETPLSTLAINLYGKAATVLPLLCKQVWNIDINV